WKPIPQEFCDSNCLADAYFNEYRKHHLCRDRLGDTDHAFHLVDFVDVGMMFVEANFVAIRSAS
ncbi:MAG TPA: hypothetical protein P5307_05540, partial [Pirellulaceae bacterium]|nr:hypothetical protein [Pirellulaceae bacterium]